MTDLRAAAQQALEAMLNFPDDISDEMFESIVALRAALAQQAEPKGGGRLPPPLQTEPVPQPGVWMHPWPPVRAQQAEPVEPVAWIQPDHLQKARVAPFLCRVEPTQRFADFVPLYLAPPQCKPLTDEEINALELPPSGTATVRDLVRLIERAHGIGETK